MAGSNEETKGIDGYLFRLIGTFEAAAMQQLGKIANPLTGDVDVSLEGAREAINMLDMVKRKMIGNLNRQESGYLDHVLYQLRMNYVEVSETVAHDAESRDSDGGPEGSADATASNGDGAPRRDEGE